MAQEPPDDAAESLRIRRQWPMPPATRTAIAQVQSIESYASSKLSLPRPTIQLSRHLHHPAREQARKLGLLPNASSTHPITIIAHEYDDAGGDEQLEQLLTRGLYRSAVNFSTRLLNSRALFDTRIESISRVLTLWQWRLLALMMLREMEAADSELQELGSLDAPVFFAEFYRFSGADDAERIGEGGSLVPFSLRLLHAQLPHYVAAGTAETETYRRLFVLLDCVERVLKSAPDPPDPEWRVRRRAVLQAIANIAQARGDTRLALRTLRQLLLLNNSSPPNDDNSPVATVRADLLAAMARTALLDGNVSLARSKFREAAAAEEHSSPMHSALGQGLLAVADDDYGKALEHFAELRSADALTSVNAQAVCLFYQGRVSDAITLMESLVFATNTGDRLITEALLFNLVMLYELSAIDVWNRKCRLLAHLAERAEYESLSIGCLRIAAAPPTSTTMVKSSSSASLPSPLAMYQSSSGGGAPVMTAGPTASD